MRYIIFFILVLCPSLSFASNTWYVRTDGGTSSQCTGLADAAYPGSGTGQACAVSHPYWLATVDGLGGGTWSISGGDTVIIASGSYMMGYGAPNTGSCNSAWAYACVLPPIPSGTDSTHPTRILGKNYDTKSTPPPELWATQRAAQVINLAGSNNTLVQYLEITDHSGCIKAGIDASACNRAAYPFGDHGDYGLAWTDSTGTTIKDLNIHGMETGGIHAGRLTNPTVDGCIFHANGNVGWDGDVGHGAIGSGTDSSNSGTITISNSHFTYNGCGETYPGKAVYGCFGQEEGNAYSDGIGTYLTGGNWVITNSEFSHNTQDGLDMLYLAGDQGGTLSVINCRMEGNAGNGIKSSAPTVVENTIVIGNCDYFNGNPLSNTTSSLYNAGGDNCRAQGTAVLFHFTVAGSKNTMINSTVYSAGSGAVMVKGDDTTCTGGETYTGRNNIFLGDYFRLSGYRNSNFYYNGGGDGNGSGACGDTGTHPIIRDEKDGLVYNFSNSECPNTNNLLCVDPLLNIEDKMTLSSTTILSYTYGDVWDVALKSSSSAIGQNSIAVGATVIGSTIAPLTDITSAARSNITWGALMHGSDGAVLGTSGSGSTGGAIPPTTSANKSGRYQSSQQVILTCTAGDAACYSTLYCLGAGCTPSLTYSAPFYMLRNIPRQTACFASSDTSSNQEATKCISLLKQKRR